MHTGATLQWELFDVIVPPLPEENSTIKMSMSGQTPPVR
jgi:hypothetical protein